MRIQGKLHKSAIEFTLRRAYREMVSVRHDDPHWAVAQARWQGLIIGLLLTLNLPEVETLITDATN